MSLFSLFFRDTLQSTQSDVQSKAVVDELDNLTTTMSAWALVEHNEDGTHNVRSAGIDFVPVGGMIRWPSGVPIPDGWLSCNGAAISRTQYPILFVTLGISQGAGDGVSTFNIPNVANFIILAA